jgi:exosortase family protein XrtF
MKGFSFSEFKPTLLFLGKFIGIYLAGNLLYGIYITAYHPRPDPVTHVVSEQTAVALTVCGWEVTSIDNKRKPTTQLIYNNKAILAVYEGCNGINTIIIFVAFIIAFGPLTRTTAWFLPMGIAIIHITNLFRIGLLFFVAEFMPQFMYFTHKYLFTAILYIVIFLLWIVWVKKNKVRKT